MLMIVLRFPRVLLILLLLTAIGCSSSDDGVAEISREASDRQAQQNQTIAEQSRQVTEATQRFVESNADARKDMIQLQRELATAEAEARGELTRIQQDLVDRDTKCRQELSELQQKSQAAMHVERQSVDRQREDLASERRQIATERQRDPVIAAAISQVGLALACLLPLVLCGYLLYVLRHSGDDDAAVTDMLIEELVSDRPRFLPLSGPVVDHESPVVSIEHSTDPGAEEQPESQAPIV